MEREPRAFLLDIIGACDEVELDVHEMPLEEYLENRQVRRAVEREFTIIGEAINALSTLDPDLFARITQARTIVDFRNQLVHGYMTVNNQMVWAIASRETKLLRKECAQLLDALDAAEPEAARGAD